MSITEYLESNKQFNAIEIFEPEGCALCEVVDLDDSLIHIYMDDGVAKIEDFEV